MPNPFSNSKKVRGWKRRLRQLERFRDANLALDVDALRLYEYHYLKIRLDPWNRLEPRNPPVWFRRRILAAFLDVLRSWHRALEATGEPYYLRLWLFHPEFHKTQVVAAMGSRIAWYEGVFEPAPHARPLPPPSYDDPAYDLRALEWEPGLHSDYVLADDAWDFDDLARLTRQATRIQETSSGQSLLVFDRGFVWQGSVPKT